MSWGEVIFHFVNVIACVVLICMVFRQRER
jgi:hypothetical protein